MFFSGKNKASYLLLNPAKKTFILHSMYSLEVDTVSNTEWSTLLQQFDDATIYQTWPCGAVLWGAGRLSHVVLRNGDEAAGIAQVAAIQTPVLRGGTALVFWGPLWRRRGGTENHRAFARLVESLRVEYVGRRGMFLRVIPNEMGSNENEVRETLERAGFSWKGRFYRTYILDISPPLVDLRKQLRQKWRNCLNRAEKEDLTVRDDTGNEVYETFYAIFQEMQERKKIAEISIDPLQLREIQKSLPEELKTRIFLCEKEKRPLAGAVISVIGDTALLVLAASNAEGRSVMASYFLQWNIIVWLKMKGVRFYDLGGTSPIHPEVNYFKAGIGGENVSHAGSFEQCANPLSSLFDRSLGILKYGRKSLSRKIS